MSRVYHVPTVYEVSEGGTLHDQLIVEARIRTQTEWRCPSCKTACVVQEGLAPGHVSHMPLRSGLLVARDAIDLYLAGINRAGPSRAPLSRARRAQPLPARFARCRY